MSQLVLDRTPWFSGQDSDDELWHFTCPCQDLFPPSLRIARCGYHCRGEVAPGPVPAVDACVVCLELRDTGVPCQFCGTRKGR